ncbi:hypothetical protein HAX54_003584, partial [Datura stramonium]|nr:hypothetical protein [Datura stramonium]
DNCEKEITLDICKMKSDGFWLIWSLREQAYQSPGMRDAEQHQCYGHVTQTPDSKPAKLNSCR